MERLCLSEQRWVQVAFPETSCLQAWSSSVQLQVIHVLLDPGFAGVSTDLPALFGLEDHSWLGAEAAGLVIIYHKVARKLPLDIREAAGGGRV